MEVSMKRLFLALTILLLSMSAFSADFSIDMVDGTYTGLVYNVLYDADIVFDISSDTSSYDLRIDVYSIEWKYLFNIWNAPRPSDLTVEWNGKDPKYSKLEAGLYLVYFEKTNSEGEKTRFFLPLLAAHKLEK